MARINLEGVRRASHAGSWYSAGSEVLNSELDSYLAAAPVTHPRTKMIIGPHAGYEYSGPTAAWSYKNIDVSQYSTVFLLGPSHHSYIKGCSLPCSGIYSTPIGEIPIHMHIVGDLMQNTKFTMLKKRDEEKEHSLEMHLPYLRKIFGNKQFQLVPIMVGDINVQTAKEYGRILAGYFRNPENLFVISSDFCHWGDNFDFKPYDRSKGQIFEFIEFLDRSGMGFIEKNDLEGFAKYLDSTGNTICGCNPIMIAMSTIAESGLEVETTFVRYAQSNPVRNQREFSVSYAASVTYLK
ncbi:hypothetical protein SteCoe_12575 [Stentor coeruleus]|uniref:Uncharacterized protein n=1 Tax=Stentor coeruleus TaxID=5963 RepID=A0A1R2CAH8_9CILI|nr:hypothetical protein SteCoe_12575 [Stentor coeruleus]